ADESRIAKVLSALPQKPMLVGLIDPFGGIRLLGAMRGAIPVPLPEFKLPETSPPPIGFAMARSDGGVTARIHVRPETVAEIVKLVGAQ
ncbi:MAG TPA: hypothetical protein VNC50_16465, partial [Planctomycetia bacterium]|nr:hypothetical protein [Planctomycetia bacterium]